MGSEILGCALNVLGVIKEIEDRARESLTSDEIFYNLRSYPIASNVARGGVQIPVSHQPKSRIFGVYDNTLKAHGIDPENVAIPEPLKQQAQFVGGELKKHGFVFSGQDWIKGEDGKFYFLEANPLPGLNIFNALFFDILLESLI